MAMEYSSGSPPRKEAGEKESYTLRISRPRRQRPPLRVPLTIYEDEELNIIHSDLRHFKHLVHRLTGMDPPPQPPPHDDDEWGGAGPSKRTRREEETLMHTTSLAPPSYNMLASNQTPSFAAPQVPQFYSPVRFSIPVMMGQHTISSPTTSSGAPNPVLTWAHNTSTSTPPEFQPATSYPVTVQWSNTLPPPSNPPTTSSGASIPPEFQGYQPTTSYPVTVQWSNTLPPSSNPPTTSFGAFIPPEFQAYHPTSVFGEPVSPPPPPWDPANPLYHYFK